MPVRRGLDTRFASRKIIDVHHHWVNEVDYLDRLLVEMDRLGIERAGLIALGAPFRRLFLTQPQPVGCCSNQDLVPILKKHADRFFGYGFFRLGHDRVELIDWFADHGFAGVKFHIPAWNYDDDRAFPVYERIARAGLVCLFHTGVFSMPEPLPGLRLSSARCRPILLDAVANEFPPLRMIMAHLGVCWGEEAAALCRVHPGVYADLSGRLDGWISSKSADWFKEMLFWPQAHRKILFGSDVHYSEMEAALKGQISIFEQMGFAPRQVEDILYNNAKEIFGLS